MVLPFGTQAERGGSGGSLLSAPEDVDPGSTNFPLILFTALADLAIDPSMLASFLVQLMSTPWCLQLNLLLNSQGVLHLIHEERRQERSCRSCKVPSCHS